MRIVSVLFCVILFMSCSNTGKKQNVKTEGPLSNTRIKFEKEVHRFNKLTEGETVGCYFTYKNTGDSPLVINNVKAGCGCTSVKYTKQPVLSGAEGEIEIRFDTRGLSGKQYKVIKVEANIPEKFIDLVISANVIY